MKTNVLKWMCMASCDMYDEIVFKMITEFVDIETDIGCLEAFEF